ncbi:MAG: hypothetical protein WC696_00510 [Candidatus Methylopumilus sp.]|jgi:hypothetical protein
MTESSPVYLREIATDSLVAAELLTPVTDRQILDWETLWKPATEKRKSLLSSKGVPASEMPQTGHWLWDQKLHEIQSLISHMSFAVTCNSQTQGLMRLDLATQRSRIESTKNQHLVYIDYLEVAPWNWTDPRFDPPKYKLAGSLLLGAAIQISQMNDFKGRVGLHSLPQAVSWYNKCGFTNFGADSSYKGNLPYMEITTENANRFLELGVSK